MENNILNLVKVGSLLALSLIFMMGCESDKKHMDIIFLHRSTGRNVWLGKTNPYIYKIFKQGDFNSHFKKLNKKHNTSHTVMEQSFPGTTLYGHKNYPYDYYNIWVKNAGSEPYLEAPTLEILTKRYDIIIFKHCYSVSIILEDEGNPDIDSEVKTIENYKLQYNALKQKMHDFPSTKFIVWTPAVRHKSSLTEAEAKRTYAFYNWIMNDWDEKGDNIYIWDFYKYATDGGLYLKDEYAADGGDSHPGKEFSSSMSPIFAKFVHDVASKTSNK